MSRGEAIAADWNFILLLVLALELFLFSGIVVIATPLFSSILVPAWLFYLVLLVDDADRFNQLPSTNGPWKVWEID